MRRFDAASDYGRLHVSAVSRRKIDSLTVITRRGRIGKIIADYIERLLSRLNPAYTYGKIGHSFASKLSIIADS